MMMLVRHDTPALVLAPMDGVTDAVMRELLTRLLPFSFCVTEFVRVNDIPPPGWVLLRDVPELAHGAVTSSGTPVHVQLLGGDPDAMATAAAAAVRSGARGIDINFGCPAPTVNRHDGGATLLKFPHRIESIVSAVRSAVPMELPVSAKLRLGWDDMGAIHDNAERAARGGAAWITIHGRTKFQGYTPPAYWEPIGEVRRALDIPVIANGEIWTLDDLVRCQDITGCRHFMLGRGVMAEPGLAAQCARKLGVPVVRSPFEPLGGDAGAWGRILAELASICERRHETARRTVSRMKQWLNYAHHRGAIGWFDSVKRCPDAVELLAAIDTLAVAAPSSEQPVSSSAAGGE